MENDAVHQIVKLYERNRLLWDSKHPDYYNKNRRDDVWGEISIAVNVPVKDLKKKMTSLLGSYRREKSREKKSQVTRSGKADVYKSKWFAFTWFSFLSDKDIPNDAVDTMDNKVSRNVVLKRLAKAQLRRDRLPTEEPIPTTSYQDDSSAPTTMSMETSVSRATKRKRRNYEPKHKSQSETLLEAFSILKKTSSPPDHYETFGNHVASELRKYDSQTLPYVKRAILDILFQADIGGFTPTYNENNNRDEYYANSGASTSPYHSSYQPTPSPPPATSS